MIINLNQINVIDELASCKSVAPVYFECDSFRILFLSEIHSVSSARDIDEFGYTCSCENSCSVAVNIMAIGFAKLNFLSIKFDFVLQTVII